MTHSNKPPINTTSNRLFTLKKGVFFGENKPMKVQYNTIKDSVRSTMKYKSIFEAIIVEM